MGLTAGTCGVRFLRTSQLLVLVELSVLHAVPAERERRAGGRESERERGEREERQAKGKTDAEGDGNRTERQRVSSPLSCTRCPLVQADQSVGGLSAHGTVVLSGPRQPRLLSPEECLVRVGAP